MKTVEPRDEAMAKVRAIWKLALEVEQSGFRDLVPRAAEVRSMAHYMLYDVDAGIEEDR